MRLLRRLAAIVVVGAFCATHIERTAAGSHAADLPSRLTDQEFWRLTEEISELGGFFQSDNLLSNEPWFSRIVPPLVAQTKPGGVYLGVGPEQNFTYIAAIRPRIAIITDIRRGNLHLQLMYKALFELSADRAEFVARLFTKQRPAGLTAASTVTELMNTYWDLFTLDEAAYAANLRAIQDHLTVTHALPLPQADLDGIARVYRAFYWYGPSITYAASTSLRMPIVIRTLSPPGGTTFGLTYRDLMTQVDANGEGLSYLGSEEKFAFLKDLQRRNLVVPVVGDFAGPKALRGVGKYLKAHGATVSAFYVSNVEGYLRRANSWDAFCANVATLPLDDASVFIRPSVNPVSGLIPIAGEVARCRESAPRGARAIPPRLPPFWQVGKLAQTRVATANLSEPHDTGIR
jgi:hypothetical protein